MEPFMMVPTIHLNGTLRRDLMEAAMNAANAVRAASEQVARTGPNGRDYYPQGDDALRKAQTEHCARMMKLKQVAEELEDLMLAIHDAPGPK
jgi:hypothetical protein